SDSWNRRYLRGHRKACTRVVPDPARRSPVMRIAAAHKTKPVGTEQIILFRASNQVFAISSASVQEVRSVDSLAGAAVEISEAGLGKVRHAIRRGERNLYVVNAALHFGLRASPAALIFLLRKSRV